ncbi:keratin 98 [Pygocentrus nattereri]|uniref:IF rod domain-containing protein n=1 Tax=Pygocentrus nattereri TaxID=42514 RepID=A0AAR2KX24_PYGNA|nr:keratin 98 [Pygocentrus nattereri]
MSFSSRSYGTYGYRALSMYGGAGGQGARISTSSRGSLYGSVWGLNLADGLDLHISTNEKVTMQNLNNRLASYMQEVHSLEKKNAKLEKNIAEWYESHNIIFCDHTDFLEKVKDLREQIEYITKCNAKTVLDIDNFRLASKDFQMMYETERNMHVVLEEDTTCIRKVLDEMTFFRSDLELQYESLKEEFIMLKMNHEQEMAEVREQATQVNVSVDAAPSTDLNKALSEIRQHYEALTAKNRSDLEMWFQSKISTVEQDVVTHSEELHYSKTELKELKSTFQTLQVELQTHHSMRMSNEESLAETEAQYSEQLAELQRTINNLELQLYHIHSDMTSNKREYDILLGLKNHLEREITEYRLLLEGEKSEHQIAHKTTTVVETLVD